MLPRTSLPRLNDWFERIMARPAAKFVYTSGTEETPKLAGGRTVAGIGDYRVSA